MSQPIARINRTMSEWRTIESAPKDGTEVLVYRDGEYAVAVWRNPYFDTIEQAEWISLSAKGADGTRSCVRMEARFPYEKVHFGTPTHWMPLPEPPRSVRVEDLTEAELNAIRSAKVSDND